MFRLFSCDPASEYPLVPAPSEKLPSGEVDVMRDVERRQEEVLRELEALEQRLAALLADYNANPAVPRKAAA